MIDIFGIIIILHSYVIGRYLLLYYLIFYIISFVNITNYA